MIGSVDLADVATIASALWTIAKTLAPYVVEYVLPAVAELS